MSEPAPTSAPALAPALIWHWKRFEALALQELYDALRFRAEVFILEQGHFLDPDGLDQASFHLMGRLAQAAQCSGAAQGVATPGMVLGVGNLVAYARVVDAGCKYAEPSLGRVACHAGLRGQGLGRALVGEALARCDLSAWPQQPNRISAQAHLAKFYGSFGYQPVGEPYAEDGIPHIEMLRPGLSP